MRLHLFTNSLGTPALLLRLIRNVVRQQRFIKKNLGPRLEAARQSADDSLDETDFKKITKYYGLAVPAILCEALCVLRGFPMTEKERMACTYQGAMTGLFDDFFDKHAMPDELLQAFMEKPGTVTGRNASERLFLQLYQEARRHFCNEELTLHYFRKVYEAQVESKKQSKPGLSQEEIKQVTINKGGVSVLFYRSVLSHPLSPEEEQALYQVGGLMQFGNDIFDVYKDSLQDIETLVTTATDIRAVRKMFLEMTRTSFNAFYKTTYPPPAIRAFLRLVSMSLCARCQVCLDQLQKKQEQTNGIFSPKKYGRADLVCDMDTPRNKWRSVLYHIRQDTRRQP